MKEKILIVNSWGENTRRGGPLMMDNLVRYFPRDFYIVLTKGNGNVKIIRNGGGKPIKYFFYQSPIDNLLAKLNSRVRNLPPYNWLVYILRMYLPSILELAVLVRQGLKVVKMEKITLLLGTSTGNPLIAVLLLHFLTGKDYTIFLFDLYDGNFLENPFDRLFARLLECHIVKNAKYLFVTNEGTREYYQRKHGVRAYVVHNSIVVDQHTKIKIPSKRKPGSPYKIIFAGVIYWAQLDSIKRIIQAVRSMRNIEVGFWIYAPQPNTSLQKMGIFSDGRIILTQASPDQMQAIIKSADIAVVPLSFQTPAPDIIRTATPGKFSEYLCAGIPILVHAPADSHLSKYCRFKKIALVVSDRSVSKLRLAIRKLLLNIELRHQMVSNNQKLFWEEYVAEANSKKFLSLLVSDGKTDEIIAKK